VNRAIVALLAAASMIVMADEQRIVRSIDLDRPGALETIQREHPDHLARIRRILLKAPDQPPEAAPGWMRAQFGASRVGYGMLYKTSNPPHAQFSFVLGDTYYTTLITLRNLRPDVVFPRNDVLPTNSTPHPDAREAWRLDQTSQPRAGERGR